MNNTNRNNPGLPDHNNPILEMNQQTVFNMIFNNPVTQNIRVILGNRERAGLRNNPIFEDPEVHHPNIEVQNPDNQPGEGLFAGAV